MAATSQRIYRSRGKPGPHPGYRVGTKDHFTPHPASSSMYMQSPSNLPGVYSNPDMAYALVAVLGCVVDVQMRSGAAYQGVLKAVSPKLSIALALAHNKAKEATVANTERLMQLEFADIISVSVLPDSNPSLGSKDIFKTDAEISRSNGSGSTKTLQPFAFDDDTAMISLNEESSGWSAEDMFETNRSKFNVESSYDEEMAEYTTSLDRSDTKDYREREERAGQLAREIEENAETHHLEDVGTEEELFSAVVRQEVAPPPSSKSTNTKPSGLSSAPGLVPVPRPPGLPSVSKPPGLSSTSQHNHHHHSHSGGQSYSAVVNTPDVRQLGKAPPPDYAPTTSSGGTNSSQTDGSSSQECHQVHSADMDSLNMRGGWTSQEESALSPSDSVEKGWPECGEYSPESDRRERGVTTSTEQADVGSSPTEVGLELEELTEEESPAQDPQDTADAEKKVQSFKLNPNAKMFSLNPGAAEFVPAPTSSLPGSPLAQSSSSPALLDSSSYQSQFPPAAGKKYPKRGGVNRTHTPSVPTPQYTPPEYVSTAGAAAGGYMYTTPHHMPAGTAAALMRSSLQQVPAQQMIQYSTSVPQFSQYPNSAGFIPQQQAITTQHLVNAGQKYIGDMSPQHQVFAGMSMTPHQLIQQTPHGQMMVSGSQPPQLSTTPGGLVTTPPMMLVQSGVTPQAYSHLQMAGVVPQVGQSPALAQNRFIQQHPPLD